MKVKTILIMGILGILVSGAIVIAGDQQPTSAFLHEEETKKQMEKCEFCEFIPGVKTASNMTLSQVPWIVIDNEWYKLAFLDNTGRYTNAGSLYQPTISNDLWFCLENEDTIKRYLVQKETFVERTVIVLAWCENINIGKDILNEETFVVPNCKQEGIALDLAKIWYPCGR